MRKALHHLAEVNGITSFGPGWEPPRHTGDGANRGGTLFLANLAMASTAWVVVGGRVYARAFVVGAFGWDDYAILGALVSGRVTVSPPREASGAVGSLTREGRYLPTRLL